MRDLSKYALLTLSIFALAFAACGDDDDDDDGQGGTGGVGGTGGDGGTGGVGGTGGDGGTGGVGGTGGTGGAVSAECEAACDNVVGTCAFTESFGTAQECGDFCTARLNEEQTSCLTTVACDAAAADACLATPECETMCEHVYVDCEAGFSLEGNNIDQAQCASFCGVDLFREAQVACFTDYDCSEAAFDACIAAQ